MSAETIHQAWTDEHFAPPKKPTISVRKAGDYYVATVPDGKTRVRRGMSRNRDEAIRRAQ